MNKIQTFILLMENPDFSSYVWEVLERDYYLSSDGYTLAEALQILSKTDVHNIMSDYWDNIVDDGFKDQYVNVEGVQKGGEHVK